MTLPIRVRLMAWYAALLTVTLVALGAFLVLRMQTDLVQDVDKRLSSHSIELGKTLIDDAEDFAEPVDAADYADLREDFQEDARAILSPSTGGALLLDAQGRTELRFWSSHSPPPEISERLRSGIPAGASQVLTMPSDGVDERYRVRLTPLRIGKEGRVLILAESLQPVESAVGKVVTLLAIAGPGALLVTGLAAFWIASRALAPVERITTDASEIGIDRLHERVSVPRSHDETRRLADTLNAMLARIETGAIEKHRLIADTSHELRTPLAIMRNEIDVALAADELSPAARAVLMSAREEVDTMTRMTDNILTSAQADEGHLELLTSWTDLRQLVEDAVRSLEPLAGTRGVRLLIEGGRWHVRVDKMRIQLALRNLIDNAIKYSPTAGSVRITCWRNEREIGVTVTDEGPGIADTDVARVFDRYYRSDDPLTAHLGGSGLGLSIGQQVAAAHGGRLWVDHVAAGGCAFSMGLPISRALEVDDSGDPTPRAARSFDL